MANRKKWDEKYDAKRAGKRTRNWLFIVYPESAPEGWQETISQFCPKWVLSPLHDKDINADGTPKKPHYHVLLIFDTVQNVEQVQELTSALNAPIPIQCKSTAAQIRYFAHLDNPEKYQYPREKIIGHGGFDVQGTIDTAADKMQVLCEIIAWTKKTGCCRFNQLVDYAMENNQTWFHLLANGYTRFLSEYLKDAWHEKQEQMRGL